MSEVVAAWRLADELGFGWQMTVAYGTALALTACGVVAVAGACRARRQGRPRRTHPGLLRVFRPADEWGRS